MSDMQRIQLTREQAEKRLELSKALSRLQQNTDFKKVIEEEYLEREAIRLVHLKAHPAQDSAESQKAIDNAITGIGEFSQFLSAVLQEGFQMRKAIEDCDQELGYIAEEMEGV